MKRRASILHLVAAEVRGLTLRFRFDLSLLTSAATAVLLSCVLSVSAHEVRPAFLELTERAPGEFDVLWKVPALGGVPLAGEELPHESAAPASNAASGATQTMRCGCPVPTASQFASGVLPIHPALPADAQTLVPPRVERLPGAELRRWTIRTGVQGLESWEVTVHGLESTMVDVLVRIALADGRVVSRLLRPDAPTFTFRAADAGPAASGYFVLGVEHILLGVDHLLFVLCLLLLVRGWGAILKTITAFTIAHSITLGLATLGYVNMPSAPVEAVIALSIVFLATEIARGGRAGLGPLQASVDDDYPDKTNAAGSPQSKRTKVRPPSLTVRAPWLVAFVFGLLHGFGFAGALNDVGLPANDIPLALLLFNFGVEAGQLLFVAAVLLVVMGLRRVATAPPAWLRPMPAYGIGAVASYWLIARVAALW